MNFEVKPGGMICGQARAQRHRYRRVVGKSGNVWYIPIDIDNPGDEIQVSTVDKSGYGGSKLTFVLEDLTEETVVGPWHSNSGALLHDTGIDISDKHRTFVVISRGMESAWPKTILTDVLYRDEKPTIGDYDRWKEIALRLWDGGPMYYYRESTGGSSQGGVRLEELKRGAA